MPSGGHARSGPAPDPNALRRDRDSGSWTTLPQKREGPTPLWPLTKATKRELALWDHAWTRPQAVMWERQQQEHEVAVHIRQFVRCEKVDATASDRRLLMQQMEALGLTQPGLARNRWRIETTTSTQAPKRAARNEGSIRDRFNVITGTG